MMDGRNASHVGECVLLPIFPQCHGLRMTTCPPSVGHRLGCARCSSGVKKDVLR